ncbi:MAG: cysteine protease StiP family protein [Undibacterium sp.]|nr:cysteine protease StiP family protein [Undibacterium sp.]
MNASFSGSYRAEDVQFLLKPLPLWDFTQVSEKELLIQTGQRHYSEMLSPEVLPTARYLQIFQEAYLSNREKMAMDCLTLAAIIARQRSENICVVSLARAGTPIGVIVKRLLETHFDKNLAHFSISIIRDRGIDHVALQHILALGHAPESIVFVDGWTGKGVISQELASAVTAFNQQHDCQIDTGLYVLADLAGTAAYAASCEDYLIPSSILNATISGLVSRSILNAQIGASDFHGCVYYEQFLNQDQSQSFADGIFSLASSLFTNGACLRGGAIDATEAAEISQHCLRQMMQRYGVTDINLIKPGIGEATRVLLRRVPRLLLLRDPLAIDVQHLRILAEEKNVAIEVDADLPYQAVSFIRSANDG